MMIEILYDYYLLRIDREREKKSNKKQKLCLFEICANFVLF